MRFRIDRIKLLSLVIQELPPPRHHTPEELFELGVSADVEEITAENAAKYRFSRPDHFTDSEQGEKVIG